jgi:hypothetical protein
MFMKNRQRRGIGQESVSQRHPPHLLDEYAENVALRLANQFKTDDFAATLRAIVRHCRDVDPKVRECLVKALQLSAKRAIDFANQLADSSTTKHTVKPTNITIGTILNGQGSRSRIIVPNCKQNGALLWRMNSGAKATTPTGRGHGVHPQCRHKQQNRR